MRDSTNVAKLREVRDRIGREVMNMPWPSWQLRMREEISRHPKLARMLARAIEPSNRPSLRP